MSFAAWRSIAVFSVSLIVSSLLTPDSLPAENWPGWRGPRGDGTSLEKGLPTKWSATDNIAWKVAVPGQGHASPVVWEDRIFIATCLTDRQQRVLLCYDRKTGKELWQKVVLESPLEKKHTLNSFASSTPATDGKLVFTTFLDKAEMVVAAYSLDGEQKWIVRPGPFSSVHGYCSCPVLFEDLVIVNGDHDGESYLVALKQNSGEIVWKVPREHKTRSYSTPIIREIAGRTQMILSGSKCVASYNPRNGERHWIIDGPTEQFVASIVYNGDLLFMTAGFPQHHMLAIRPDGEGNVTESHIAWRTREAASYVPSPIAAGDYFLVTSDNGIASCFAAKTGERLWKNRLGKHYSTSPVLIDSLVYFTADDGVTTVIRPGKDMDIVAKNELGEYTYASPAVSQGQIFVRGEKHLYAIGAGEKK